MSHREGHATGEAAAPTPPADALLSVVGASPAWEEVLPVLPLPQQRQLLNLARHQAASSTDLSPANSAHRTLELALANGLPPAPLVDPLDVHDPDLDDDQRDAVARAIQTPDLLLLEGPPGTGKSRVAVEIVRQAADRGGRVLLLSPDVAALDDLLLRLAEIPGLAVQRRLAPDESADRLSPAIAALTPARREAALRDRLFHQAESGVAAAQERVRRAESTAPLWDELTPVREERAALAVERTALAARRDSLADEVRRDAEAKTEPAPFYIQRLRGVRSAYAKQVALLEEQANELHNLRSDAEARRRDSESECMRLRPRADALKAGRWYSPIYWMARFDRDVTPRLADADAQLAAASAALDELTVREQKLSADRRFLDAEYAADQSRLMEAEVTRRLSELNDRAQEFENREAEVAARESALLDQLRQAGTDPSGGPAAAEAERSAARAELKLAQDRVADLQARTDEVVRESVGPPSVVAGPIAGLDRDPELSAMAFDWLVVDDAQGLTESDFLGAAALARRWILVGERNGASPGATRGRHPDLFARLTLSLRPGVWNREGKQFVCRLHAVRGADRNRLECEPVVDAPDIELRLFTPPDGDPALAEVVFPDRMTAATAREYLCRELGEVTCEPRRRTAIWKSNADGIVLSFGPADPGSAFAAVGPGIREELVDLETRSIHFGSEWTMDQAREWAADHVGRRDSGRCVHLRNSHRACPGLARWLNRAFSIGYSVNSVRDEIPHVEFLAVPDMDPRRRRENGRPGRLGGAGYEIDLADPRQRAALPSDLASLPNSGYVNIPEAQALVRFLESLPSANVVVTSPFPAQAMVLRMLLDRSGRLSTIRVLDPREAARSECDFLAVSLTRSHVARAVPFGDGPAILGGLLTRVRRKVLFAGDPGTLARRLQWEGPVDHLDVTDAARERAWVAALADCPRVAGPRHRPSAAESAWA